MCRGLVCFGAPANGAIGVGGVMKAKFCTRAGRLLAVVVVASTAALTGAPLASSDTPNAMAHLEDSIVFLQTDWSGFVQVPPSADAAGNGYWTDKLKYSVTCTGFYVSKTAQIVTAGHCVDPAEGRKVILDGYLTDQKAQDMTDQAYANWHVEGDTQGSPVERSVRAIQPNGVDGATITAPTTVEVVDFKAPDAGDVALLHLPNMNKETPGLVLAEKAPEVGAEVTSIGFPGDIQDITDPSQIARASFKTGTVSSSQVTPTGVVQIEVSSTLAGGMSGGPTVNKDGQVVGVNSNGLTHEANFNFITNTPDLRTFLVSHNVILVAPPAPARSGTLGMLWYIIGGVALLLAVAAVVLFLVLRARRPSRPEAIVGAGAPGGYPAQGPTPYPSAPYPSAPIPTPIASGVDGDGVQQTSVAPEPAPGQTVLSATSSGFCANCGAPHKPEDHFCPGCGRPLT